MLFSRVFANQNLRLSTTPRPAAHRPPLLSLSPYFVTSLPPYLGFVRHRDEKPVTATPLESVFTNCDACNPFRIRFYENCRVSYPSCSIFVSLPTFLHKSAFANPFVFYALPTLPSSVS